MSPKSAELLKQALELSVKERADLAAQIMESLDSSDDPEVQAAWQAEIERRMADVDSGAVKPISLDEFQRRLKSSVE